jgi:RNA processing factor Prp31
VNALAGDVPGELSIERKCHQGIGRISRTLAPGPAIAARVDRGVPQRPAG